MTMYYGDVVREFAIRTRKNLKFIESHLDEPGVEVYEVTQLVNSLVGLLIFPQQAYFNQIPSTPLAELERQGWPHIKTAEGFTDYETLSQLLRYLRNSVAHYNVKFLYNEFFQIIGIKVWNVDTHSRKRPKTWEADLSVQDLQRIVEHFVEMLENYIFVGHTDA